MSKLHRVLGASAALVAAGVFSGSCGGSTSDGPGPTADTGPATDSIVTPTDSKAESTPGEVGGDAKPKPDAGPTPDVPSTLLAEGNFQMLANNGITSDDFLVVFDDKGAAVAIPTGGGAAITIDPATSGVLITGKTVFSWSGVDTKTNVGKLSVWTKATGLKQLSTNSIFGFAAADADGTRVVYSDAARSTGVATDISIAAIDGTGVKKSVIAVAQNDKTCAPIVTMAGTTAYVSYCLSTLAGGGDAGVDAADDSGDSATPSVTAQVVRVDVAGTVTTVLASAPPESSTSPLYLEVNKAGDKVMTIDNAGALAVIAGGSSLPIDTGVKSAQFAPDGATLLYLTTGGSLKKAAASATPAPVTIAATGAAGIDYISPDSKYVYYSSKITAGLGDLFLAPTAGGATPVTLVADFTGAIFGDGFTADMSNAVFYQNVTKDGVGDMMVRPVAGGTSTKLATGVWLSYSPVATKIAYNDNWNAGSGAPGTADIHVVDIATKAPKLVAYQADNSFYLSNKKDKIIFVTTDPSVDKSGAYAASIP